MIVVDANARVEEYIFNYLVKEFPPSDSQIGPGNCEKDDFQGFRCGKQFIEGRGVPVEEKDIQTVVQLTINNLHEEREREAEMVRRELVLVSNLMHLFY